MIYKKGFTLLELLVVISVIGILASVVMVSLNNSKSKARDAKTLSDVDQIKLALTLYKDANGSYPGGSGWKCLKPSAEGTCFSGAYSGDDTVFSGLSTYLSPIPRPNVPSGNYLYSAFLYNGNATLAGYGPGPFLIYSLERPFASSCRGFYQGQVDTGYYQCYGYMGE